MAGIQGSQWCITQGAVELLGRGTGHIISAPRSIRDCKCRYYRSEKIQVVFNVVHPVRDGGGGTDVKVIHQNDGSANRPALSRDRFRGGIANVRQ